MKKTNFKFSFETMLLLVFVVLIVTSVIAAYQFYAISSIELIEDQLFSSYRKAFDTFKEDFNYMNSFVIKDNSLILSNNDESKVIRYSLTDGSLIRHFGDNQPNVLVKELKSVDFITPSLSKNLLTVILRPNNPQLLPFMTSFSIRDIKNE